MVLNARWANEPTQYPFVCQFVQNHWGAMVNVPRLLCDPTRWNQLMMPQQAGYTDVYE